MISGGPGGWRSRGSRDAMPKPGQPDRAGFGVDQDVGGLDVLVDEAAPVDIAERRRHADGEAQEASHLHRRAENPVERLAAGVLEHQHGPAMVAHKLQRPHRPGAV